eukprot:scaffold72604_cov26-Prasinocladus_malaysianus.AAC.1
MSFMFIYLYCNLYIIAIYSLLCHPAGVARGDGASDGTSSQGAGRGQRDAGPGLPATARN